MTQLGIVTYNIAKDWDLPTILSRLEKLGYGGVELRTGHAHKVEVNLTKAQRDEVRKRFEDSPVELAGLGSRLRIPGDRPGGRAQEHRGDQGVRPPGPRHRLSGREGPAQRHPQGCRPRPDPPPDRPRPPRDRRGCRRVRRRDSRRGPRRRHAGAEALRQDPRVRRPSQRLRLLELEPDRRDRAARSRRPSPWSRPRSARSTSATSPTPTYPWRELFALLPPSSYEGYTLAEIPESTDPERVLRYFKALWLAYQPEARSR